MPNNNYISKIKVGNQIYWVKDIEARTEMENYLPLTGGEVSGDITIIDPTSGDTNVVISNNGSITAKNLILEDIQEKTTTIPNVLTLDTDDTIKYHSTDNFLAEIGGYSAKAEPGLLTLKLGKE